MQICRSRTSLGAMIGRCAAEVNVPMVTLSIRNLRSAGGSGEANNETIREIQMFGGL